jgi:hypothetical protein
MESGRLFPYEDVLNPSFRKVSLGPGKSIEGILLAYGIDHTIPGEYLHREIALGLITIIDQFRRKHSTEIEMTVDRAATNKSLAPRSTSPGLFASTSHQVRLLPQEKAQVLQIDPNLRDSKEVRRILERLV